jgi:hypothetical protein
LCKKVLPNKVLVLLFTQIASIGALLDHLVRERAVNDLEDEGIAGLEVRDIEALSLSALSFLL